LLFSYDLITGEKRAELATDVIQSVSRASILLGNDGGIRHMSIALFLQSVMRPVVKGLPGSAFLCIGDLAVWA